MGGKQVRLFILEKNTRRQTQGDNIYSEHKIIMIPQETLTKERKPLKNKGSTLVEIYITEHINCIPHPF